MNLGNILNSALFAWGLAGLLMVMLALLAFLRSRERIKERLAILVIAGSMLLALLALTLAPQ
jgi:hypothetical protein